MLMELLSKAAAGAMLSFVVSSMLAMGAGLTVSQISEPADTRRVMALGTGQRNMSQSFSDPKVVVMVIVVAIVGLIILMPLSRALASR